MDYKELREYLSIYICNGICIGSFVIFVFFLPAVDLATGVSLGQISQESKVDWLEVCYDRPKIWLGCPEGLCVG